MVDKTIHEQAEAIVASLSSLVNEWDICNAIATPELRNAACLETGNALRNQSRHAADLIRTLSAKLREMEDRAAYYAGRCEGHLVALKGRTND